MSAQMSVINVLMLCTEVYDERTNDKGEISRFLSDTSANASGTILYLYERMNAQRWLKLHHRILMHVRAQFSFGCVHYLFIYVACTFSSFHNVLVLLYVIFLTYMCCPRLCSHGGWLLLTCSAVGIGFNGAETNCGIARILGILLMNSWDT